jgi:hypothetical protein
MAGFSVRKFYIFLFLERLADFSYLAVWVQVFPLALHRLLHPAHQATALRPLDPVPGLEAENVAKCRYRCVFSFYFFLEKKILTGQEFAATMRDVWVESSSRIHRSLTGG